MVNLSYVTSLHDAIIVWWQQQINHRDFRRVVFQATTLPIYIGLGPSTTEDVLFALCFIILTHIMQTEQGGAYPGHWNQEYFLSLD